MLIALDADDTLWHCEAQFQDTQARFAALLTRFAAPETVAARLTEVEGRNLAVYGYGVKGFALSMIETALELTEGQVDGTTIAAVLDLARGMMNHPVEPLPGVTEALERLAALAPLVLITKGDLFHQEAKLAASGLGHHFAAVEIVSTKTAATYARVFARHGAAPDRCVMAGNSVRSDVLPVIEAGGYAALVPYPIVWAHESAEAPHGHPRFRECATLAELPDWVASIT